MYSYELLYSTLDSLAICQYFFCASIVTLILYYLVASDSCEFTVEQTYQNKKIHLNINFIRHNNLSHPTEKASWQLG